MFPLFFNLESRTCVVVGGGRVGSRRAAALARAGANVRLVSPGAMGGRNNEKGIEWIRAAYECRHLDGAWLVFACAPPDVNRRVAVDARARHLPVNVADDPAGSDFIVPAAGSRGPLTVAVSSGGAGPVVARALRDRLLADVDDAHVAWALLLKKLRPLVREAAADPVRRAAVYEGLADPKWVDQVRRHGSEATEARMREAIRSRGGRPADPV